MSSAHKHKIDACVLQQFLTRPGVSLLKSIFYMGTISFNKGKTVLLVSLCCEDVNVASVLRKRVGVACRIYFGQFQLTVLNDRLIRRSKTPVSNVDEFCNLCGK